jgi:uncharacterized protein (TIGR00251 family)
MLTKRGIILKLHVSPNAAKTHISGMHGDSLKLRLKAPPVDGKANKELIKFLNTSLKSKKVKCEIVSGQTSRDKHVLLKDFFDTKWVESIFCKS